MQSITKNPILISWPLARRENLIKKLFFKNKPLKNRLPVLPDRLIKKIY